MEVQEKDLLVLAKLLGMLGTDNPHERAAFAAKAHAWVSQRGLQWVELLVPPEGAPVEVEVNVGGRKTAHAGPHTGAGPGQPPPGNGAAQGSAYANGGQAGPQAQAPHNWARGPAWGPLVEEMLANHTAQLRGSRENSFLTDQLARAMQYGNSTRLSDKQENWLRDILGRAGLTW